MKTDSQAKQILDYMLTGCKITPLEALRLFGSLNLRNRICEIRNEYNITPDRKLIPVKTSSGVKHVMQYWVESKPKQRSNGK